MILPARFWVYLYPALQWVNDRVISPARVWAVLPNSVQMILPTRFRVYLYLTLQWVNVRVISPARVWAVLPNNVQMILPARFWVYLYPTPQWVNMFVTPLWVHDRTILLVQLPVVLFTGLHTIQPAHLPVYDIAILPVHCPVALHDHFWASKNSACSQVNDVTICSLINDYAHYLSVWRNPTTWYDITEYPYFVFHPKQSDFSSFSETFKSYTYCLLQYRLIHVIEFVFCWSNQVFRFMSQNMTMLINFDLAPWQYCQRVYLAMCRSQYYKHDFAVISSVLGISTNYVAVSYVKYLENIIHCILQHKYLYRISVWSSAKKDSKNDHFKHLEQNSSSKIGGG
jgi:hypothetical protein